MGVKDNHQKIEYHQNKNLQAKMTKIELLLFTVNARLEGYLRRAPK